MLIIKPDIACNTKHMYKRIDSEEKIFQLEKTDKIIEALTNNNLKLLSDNLYNVFEYVVEEKDVIQNLKNELIEKGAMGSIMTGSGSCVYGIFENKETAKRAYDKLKKQYQIYICTSYNSKRREVYDR